MDKAIEHAQIVDKTKDRTFEGMTIMIDHKFTPSPDRDCFVLTLYSGGGDEEGWSDSVCIPRSSHQGMQELNAVLWLLEKSQSYAQTAQYDFPGKRKPVDSLLSDKELRYGGSIQQDIIYRLGKSIFLPTGFPICTLFALDAAQYDALGQDPDGYLEAVLDMFSYDTFTHHTDDTEWECPAWPTDDCSDLHEIYVESLVYHDVNGAEWPCRFSFDKNIMDPEIMHVNLDKSLKALPTLQPEHISATIVV